MGVKFKCNIPKTEKNFMQFYLFDKRHLISATVSWLQQKPSYNLVRIEPHPVVSNEYGSNLKEAT